MPTCQVDARERARSAAGRLLTFPSVVSVDVLEPATDPTDCWTLDLLTGSDGLPPTVAGVIAEFGLTVRTVSPQGRLWHVVAVAQ